VNLKEVCSSVPVHDSPSGEDAVALQNQSVHFKKNRRSRRGRSNRGRSISGILILDKPQGLTSNAALQEVKRLFNASKAGHTGSLDPLATGVLPICFGEATKFSQFLLDSDKAYTAKARLGLKTETGDADGNVISERPVPELSQSVIDDVLANFRGKQQQIPSMYSAIKHNGEPLYKLARQGITVERKARDITIMQLEGAQVDSLHLTIDVECTKGTYIRTLVEDIGDVLGCGAHVAGLRRTQAGPFNLGEAVTMDHLCDLVGKRDFIELNRLLKPLDTAVRDWPGVNLSESSAFYMKQGHPVQVSQAPTEGWVRLQSNDEFFGVGEVLSDGRVAPRRLLSGPVLNSR
jgi:tRNA pseudouridine55 synthase